MNTTTPLEAYFQFVRSETDDILIAIRLAGTRVGIEFVLREYLQGASPEELALRFPTLSLEQIHATITYYLAQEAEVSRYLRIVWQRQQTDAETADVNPSPFLISLRHRLESARRRQSQDQFLNIAAD
jgi:uncharacterized protein (DUF433 family)